MGKSQLFLAAATAAVLVAGLVGPAAANAIPNTTAFDDSSSFTPIALNSFDYTTFGTTLNLSGPAFTGNVTIGGFIANLDAGGGSFDQLVFCDDMGNVIDPNHDGPYSFFASDPNIPAGATDYLSPLSQDQIDGIIGLVTDAFVNLPSGDAAADKIAGAAYQLAIWNLEYGDLVTTDNTDVNNLAATFEADALDFFNNEFLGSGLGPVQLESPCDTTLVGKISYQATPFPLDDNKDNCQIQGLITLSPTIPPNNLVPEPATMAILGSGLIGLGAFRRRRRKAT